MSVRLSVRHTPLHSVQTAKHVIETVSLPRVRDDGCGSLLPSTAAVVFVHCNHLSNNALYDYIILVTFVTNYVRDFLVKQLL